MILPLKICGLRNSDDIAAALKVDAGYLGLVIHPPSIRHVTIAEAASLRALIPAGRACVAVTVNPSNALLDELSCAVAPDLLQVHEVYDNERLQAVSERSGLPVIQAVPACDFLKYLDSCADMFLFDSATPGSGHLAESADLLRTLSIAKPWFLAGGLNADNLAAAAENSGARLFDVSSGVESERGRKCPRLMEAFAAAVRRTIGHPIGVAK